MLDATIAFSRRIRAYIKKRAYTTLDPELRAIRKIIFDGEKASKELDGLSRESNAVFTRRLETFPQALKMSFWEDHFEWKSLQGYPEIHGRVLDFGCGSGHLDIMLARSGRFVKGIDLSPIGIAIANYLKGKEKHEVQGKLSFEVADVTKPRRANELYDSAWSAHVFEHIADPGPVLLGLKTWLRPGAYLLISVPLGYAYDDPGHVNHFKDADQLKQFLEKYTVVERIDTCSQFNVLRALCKFQPA